jgi:membrane protein required for colicin V production
VKRVWSIDMSWIDYVIIAVVVLSILLGALRGLVREFLSLAGWVLAAVLSLWFGADAAQSLPADWSPVARLALASVLIFVATVFAAGLLASVLGRLLKAAGLGGTDRTLGAVFGLCRGLFAVVALMLMAGLTQLTSQPAWKQAVLIPRVTALILIIKPHLPENMQVLVKTGQADSR